MKPLDMPKKADKAEAAPAEVKKEEVIDFSKVEIEPLFADQVDFDTFSKSDFRAVKIKACEAVKKSKKLLKFVLDDGTGVDRVILSGIHEYYEPEELVGKTCIAITNLPPRAMMGIDSCGMLISAVHHENGEEKLHLADGRSSHFRAGAKALLIAPLTRAKKASSYTNPYTNLHQGCTTDAEKNVRLNFSLAEVILRGCFCKTIYSDMRLGEE